MPAAWGWQIVERWHSRIGSHKPQKASPLLDSMERHHRIPQSECHTGLLARILNARTLSATAKEIATTDAVDARMVPPGTQLNSLSGTTFNLH